MAASTPSEAVCVCVCVCESVDDSKLFGIYLNRFTDFVKNRREKYRSNNKKTKKISLPGGQTWQLMMLKAHSVNQKSFCIDLFLLFSVVCFVYNFQRNSTSPSTIDVYAAAAVVVVIKGFNKCDLYR